MDLRRSSWFAVVRLALVVSLAAVAVTLAISAFGDVSQTALVIAVIVVGFIISWIQSGRTDDDGDPDVGTSDRHERSSTLHRRGADRAGRTRRAEQRVHRDERAPHRVVVVPAPQSHRHAS